MPRYTEQEAREAIRSSFTLTDALRKLGLRPAGGNHRVLRQWVAIWEIPTDHFDQDRGLRERARARLTPLDEVLVEHSTYSRGKLKQRLYETGMKERACELCGQDEMWRGRQMSLILDHVNGIADDNRLDNLRIVCPNCNATLDTHCGRRNRMPAEPRQCLHCGEGYRPKFAEQKYCSRLCGRHSRGPRDPHPERRKVQRPPRERLLDELTEKSWSAVARRYGVSDNAVRKWVSWYGVDIDEIVRLRARRRRGGDDPG